MEPLYQTAALCPCCGNGFETPRVRPSFKRAVAVDTDFCSHFKGIHADYYVVRVCPQCGFSTTENSLSSLTDAQKENYYSLYGRMWQPRSYSGARTSSQALDCYKLALLSAVAAQDKDRLIAGLLHHIAWLYRDEGDSGQEMRFLRHALESYRRVYETEKVDNDAKLMYLIGELHRRLGERKEAVWWFSRVVNDKRIVDAAMIKASRSQWQLVREGNEDAPEWMMGGIPQTSGGYEAQAIG
ncbi:DUF2225 domain-containing protein [Paenibacillus humicus]|uniref:DUF2225 domain-containing protein n=1 Tax=Paenibacillus humicus TaxID=412861 RepID=UPI000FD770B7|nr:DUF2225 domain-containing protein [Paenibacillus humicus]